MFDASHLQLFYAFGWVLPFQQLYPKVHINLQLDNHYLNLLATALPLS
jgi:hypothetical protein